MIEKLRKKVTLIILSAITIPFIIIISFYVYSYYHNTIRANSLAVDRFFGGPEYKRDCNGSGRIQQRRQEEGYKKIGLYLHRGNRVFRRIPGDTVPGA